MNASNIPAHITAPPLVEPNIRDYPYVQAPHGVRIANIDQQADFDYVAATAPSSIALIPPGDEVFNIGKTYHLPAGDIFLAAGPNLSEEIVAGPAANDPWLPGAPLGG